MWDRLLDSIPMVLGGGVVGVIISTLAQVFRSERIDRVAELAQRQQVALDEARDAEMRLREALSEQKRERFELEERWQARFDAMEDRYSKKCAEIEDRAREREIDYQGQIAELSAELVRLKTLMLRCGIDPERGVQIPGTGELRSPAIKY